MIIKARCHQNFVRIGAVLLDFGVDLSLMVIDALPNLETRLVNFESTDQNIICVHFKGFTKSVRRKGSKHSLFLFFPFGTWPSRNMG